MKLHVDLKFQYLSNEITKINMNFRNHLSLSNKNSQYTKGIIEVNEKSITKNKESIEKIQSLYNSIMKMLESDNKINKEEIKSISEKINRLNFIEGKTETEFIEMMAKYFRKQFGKQLDEKLTKLFKGFISSVKDKVEKEKLLETIIDLRKTIKTYREEESKRKQNYECFAQKGINATCFTIENIVFNELTPSNLDKYVKLNFELKPVNWYCFWELKAGKIHNGQESLPLANNIGVNGTFTFEEKFPRKYKKIGAMYEDETSKEFSFVFVVQYIKGK